MNGTCGTESVAWKPGSWMIGSGSPGVSRVLNAGRCGDHRLPMEIGVDTTQVASTYTA